MAIKVVLLGPPGAGKGTLGKWIEKEYELERVCVGDLLREAVAKQTDLGRKIEKCLNAGEWIENQWVIRLVRERLGSEKSKVKGWLLDGCPRSSEQFEALGADGLLPDFLIHLSAPQSELLRRLLGRRIHLPSGRVYHTIFAPPKQPGLDDVTGEPLSVRKDDTPEVARKRLLRDEAQAAPVLEEFKRFSEDHPEQVRYLKLETVMGISAVQEEIRRWLGRPQIADS